MRKYIINTAFLALFSTMVVTGCREFENEFLDIAPDVPEMTEPGIWTESEKVYFDAEFDKGGFELRALGGDWSIKPKEEYSHLLDYSPKDGKDGNFVIEVKIQPNNGMEDRDIVFIVKQENTDVTKEITVRQYTHESKFTRETDSLALLKIAEGLYPDDWMPQNKWNPKKPITTWAGLTFEEIRGEMRVVGFGLNDWNMWGEIAPELGNLRELKVWNMTGGKLKGRLPSSISYLRNLHTININFSQNTSIFVPENMDNMLSLKILKIGSLKVTYFENLYKIPNLEELVIGSGVSGDLNEGIGKMKKLKKFILSYSKVTKLPEDIGGLDSLVELDASGTNLGSIPNSLSNLKLLAKLNISSTKVVSLPESIGNISTLNTIMVSNCSELESLPESFVNIPINGELTLSNCGLKTLPSGIGRMSGVTKLNISNCQSLESMPSDMGKTITDINMSNCAKITQFPLSICAMSQLKILNMSNCGITSLPSQIGDMVSLENLNLNSAKITSLPDEMGKLIGLKTLSLNNAANNIDCSGSLLEKWVNIETISMDKCRFSDAGVNWMNNMTKVTSVIIKNSELNAVMDWSAIPSTLKTLDLTNGNISGTLDGIENIPATLTSITLTDNKFTGDIPKSISKCTKLTRLSIANNNITGTIIEELLKTSMTSWSSLTLTNNCMSGEIPQAVLSSTNWNKWRSTVTSQKAGYGFTNVP